MKSNGYWIALALCLICLLSFNYATLTDNLVSYYMFENSSGLLLDELRNNDSNDVNGVNYEQSGLINYSYYFENTPSDREFVGYLYLDNNVFVNFEVEGYQTFDGKILDIDLDVERTKFVIHSHPNGWCYPSQTDLDGKKILDLEVSCIICGVDSIECY